MKLIPREDVSHLDTAGKLGRLADILENEVPDEAFELTYWADTGFEEQKCGTAACAFGWAASVFTGLRIDGGVPYIVGYSPNSYEHAGFEAAAKFFSIDRDMAEFLFDPDMYVPANEVEIEEGEEDGPTYSRAQVVERLRYVAEWYGSGFTERTLQRCRNEILDVVYMRREELEI